MLILMSLSLSVFADDTEGRKLPYLGIVFGEISDEQIGVDVFDVVAESPAADAGLSVGDRLLSLDSQPISGDTLVQTLLQYVPGDRVMMRVLRDNTERDMSIILGLRPDIETFLDMTASGESAFPELGLLIDDAYDGARISGLYDAHPNASERVELWDRLIALDGHPVSSAASLREQLEHSGNQEIVTLQVERDGQAISSVDLTVVSGSIYADPASLSTTSPVIGMLLYEAAQEHWIINGGVVYPFGDGITADDVILAFDGQQRAPDALETFLYDLTPDRRVVLTVQRGDTVRMISVSGAELTNGGHFYLIGQRALLLPFWEAKAI
jgi:hypothetical protein